MRVNADYRLKGVPKLNDRPWGWDVDGGQNTTFTVEGMLRAGGVLNSSIDVRMYGAVGDGAADDTAAIQAALGAAAGRWVNFPPGNYRITSSLNTPVGTRIIGYGARVFNTTSHIYLMNVNGDTIIKGLELEGAGATPHDWGARGISFAGTLESYKSGLVLEDCHLHDIGFSGVYLNFVKDVTIKNTRVIDVGYGGIEGYSVENVYVGKSHIKGIHYIDGGYNITFTRYTTPSDTLESNPRSKNCTVENCLIEDNEAWKGLDTHGGDNIRFINNRILNTSKGIGIIFAGAFGPKNCIAYGNFIYSTVGATAGGNEAYGIAVAGAIDLGDLSTSVDYAENCSITNNILILCGHSGNTTSGAVRCRNTRNLGILGNRIVQPRLQGILIQHTNYNFVVQGNSIEDPHDPTLLTTGIRVSLTYNRGLIEGNSLMRFDPSVNTMVADRGIVVGSATDNYLTIKNNPNNFTTPFSIPVSANITTDTQFNQTLVIAKGSFSSNPQIQFDEGFSLHVDNVNGIHSTEKRSFWIRGAVNSTLYLSPSSGSYEWVSIIAKTVQFPSARVSIPTTSTLEPEGTVQNVNGNASSGNAFKNGLHYTTITTGLSNNYPAELGLSFVVKAQNSRILEYFAGLEGELWYRTLNLSFNNSWQRVRTVTGRAQTLTTSGALNNLAIGATTDHLILTNCTSLTGIISGLEGRELIIENRNSVSIAFTADSGSSDAANRTAFTYTLLAGEMLKIKYASTKWRRVN